MPTKKVRLPKTTKLGGIRERWVMTDRDRDRFLAALNRPAKPLPELKEAAKLHARLIQGEQDVR